MTISDDGSAARRALFERIKAILLRPKEEWPVIDVEPATIKGLYTGYICILAAIGPACMAIGQIIIGESPLRSMLFGLLNYGAWLLGAYVLARLVDYLAPRFGGQPNAVQALKVAAYAGTASMLSGVFSLFTWTAPLAIVGFYSLYLLYLGAPRLMRIPDEKASDFGLAVIGVAIVAGIVFVIAIAVVLWPLFLVGAVL